MRSVGSCSSGPEFCYRNAQLQMHVQMLGDTYPLIREFLPLNFFLTAVRAWRPLIHLFEFVFDRQ